MVTPASTERATAVIRFFGRSSDLFEDLACMGTHGVEGRVSMSEEVLMSGLSVTRVPTLSRSVTKLYEWVSAG